MAHGGGRWFIGGDGSTRILAAVIAAAVVIAGVATAAFVVLAPAAPPGPSPSSSADARATTDVQQTADAQGTARATRSVAPSSPAASSPLAGSATATPAVFSSGSRLPAGTMPETEEEPGGAPTFANISTLEQGDQIPNGVTVGVYCRLPGAHGISSAGETGWYKIMDLDHKIGYVAANTFYNDPGNGYGTVPNPAPYDPKVPICGGS